MRIQSIILALSLGLLPLLATALPTDRDQPIHIESDQADIDEKKDTAIYTGDVIVNQGSLRIRAQRLIIHGLGGPDKIVATGKPARFRQRPKPDSQEIFGEALTLELHPDSNMLYLVDSAKVTQNKNTFAGYRIEYNLKRDLVKARSNKERGERVKVVIQPRQSKQP